MAKGERDKTIEWQDGVLFIEIEWDGLWFQENEWNGLWFEGNEWCYDKSSGDERLSDDVVMGLECYEINDWIEKW